MYLFSNIIGVFIFNEQFKIVDEIFFKDLEDYKNKDKLIEQIKNKHKNFKQPNQEELRKILLYFKNPRFSNYFYNINLKLTKYDVKNSVNKDTLLIQAINSVDEVDKVINLLVKRLQVNWDIMHIYANFLFSH